MGKRLPNDDTSKRLENLEKKFEFIEKTLTEFQIKNFDRNSTENFRYQLAKNVTGLIGLEESLSERGFLRYVWSILFFLGVAATAFFIFKTVDDYANETTATSVKLITYRSYSYPPLLLCPDGWLDFDKASRYNLSDNALVYSLGYVDYFNQFEIPDTSSARSEFLKFYENRNFSSLIDYYKTITVDVQKENSITALAAQDKSSYLCKGCEETKQVEHVCMNGGMCYAIWFKPDEAGSALGLAISSNTRKIVLKLANKTGGLMHVSPDWELYFSPDLNLLTSESPYLIIQSNFFSMVRLSAQKFYMMNKPGAFCLPKDELPFPGYTTESCMAECQNRMYKEKIKCLLLPLSSGNSQHPKDYCNTLEKILNNVSITDYVQSAESSEIDSKFGQCLDECPYKCERILYQTTLEAITSMSDYDPENLSASAISMGMSLIYVDMVHSATIQGGITTMKEIQTHSLIDLVSNIGGTLGLFVGATLMTFVQVALFCLNYLMRNMRRVDENAKGDEK